MKNVLAIDIIPLLRTLRISDWRDLFWRQIELMTDRNSFSMKSTCFFYMANQLYLNKLYTGIT